MAAPIEETKTLIARHNFTAEKMWKTLKLGGCPSPSIAITKADMEFQKYGDFSVVFRKSTIDPQADSRNKAYGSDAWTPTDANARVDYEVNYDAVRSLENRIAELSKGIAGGIFSKNSTLRGLGIEDTTTYDVQEIAQKLAQRDEVKAAYLQGTGKTLEPVMQFKQFNRNWSNSVLSELTELPERLRNTS